MLTSAGEDIPVAIAKRLEPDEVIVATLRGRLESGFVLTERRLFGWRANGAAAPLPVGAIERVLVDAGKGSEHLDLVILPRQAVHPPLVLTRRAGELVSTLAFVGQVAAASKVEPVTEHLGPVYRFTFPGRGA